MPSPRCSVARSVGRTPAQVVLRWHLQRGDIVFPKSVNPERIKENIEIFDFELAAADMAAIAALNGQQYDGRALTVNEAKPREERGDRAGGACRRHPRLAKSPP